MSVRKVTTVENPSSQPVRRSNRFSTATKIAQEALENSPVNSPKKPSVTKRSAKHLKGDEGWKPVQKTVKVQKRALQPVLVQNDPLPAVQNEARPTFTYPDGKTYTGQWLVNLGNVLHGHGILTYPSGATYEGSFVYNKMEGEGTYTFPDGEKIVASFVDGKPHGYGTDIFPDGLQYKGLFFKGEKQSEGIWSGPYLPVPVKHMDTVDGKLVLFTVTKIKNGYMYSGQCAQETGQAHGLGAILLSTGERYFGSFRNKLLEGYGNYTNPNGTSYIGFFRNHKYEGSGILIKNGSKYIGLFKNGLMHGHGISFSKNGTAYIGEYAYGKPNGHGKAIRIHGTIKIKEGQWKDKEFLPFETVKLQDGEYVGQRVDGECHGYGTVSYPNGSQFKGQFVHGKREGMGTWTDAHGTVTQGIYQEGKFLPFETVTSDYFHYVGQILNGQFHGRGTILYADGTQYEGQFVHGNKEGNGIWIHPDGTVSEGRYQDGEFLTFNINHSKQGSVYAGECTSKGLPHGHGTLTYANGKEYVGSFRNGKRESGYEVKIYPNGSTYEELWVHGEPYGDVLYTDPLDEEESAATGARANPPRKTPHYREVEEGKKIN